MQKLLNKMFKKSIVLLLIIPLVLFFIWIFLTLLHIFQYDESFLVLSKNHEKDIIRKEANEKIFASEKVTGEFVASEDNLGIVSIRFDVPTRVPYREEDRLIFRLKEKGEKKWYYENTYRSGLIYEVPLFPFGFPLIENSQGKTYLFELESLSGNNKNAVFISNIQPNFVSKYQATKNELLSSNLLLFNFLSKKILNSLSNVDILFASFVYFLPLFFYILWTTRIFSPIHQKVIQSVIFVMVIFIDFYYLQVINNTIYLVLIGIWMYSVITSKSNSLLSLVTGLILLIFSGVLIQFGDQRAAEKATSWAFIFFAACLIQTMFEINKIPVKKNKRSKI